MTTKKCNLVPRTAARLGIVLLVLLPACSKSGETAKTTSGNAAIPNTPTTPPQTETGTASPKTDNPTSVAAEPPKLELETTFTPPGALLNTITFAKDHSFVTDGSSPRLWKLGQKEPLAEMDEIGDSRCAAFSSDGSLIAFACRDGSIGLWDVKAKAAKKPISVTDKGIVSVAFGPDNAMVIVGDYEGRVSAWNVKTGKKVWTAPVEQRGIRAAVSPSGRHVATAGQTAALWDASTGKKTADLKFREERLVRVMDVAFSPDGKWVATAEATLEATNAVILWSVDNASQTGMLPHELGVSTIAFSPDGQWLASAGMDSDVRVWRVADKKLVQTLKTESNAMESVAWSADGQRLAAIGGGDTVRIWRVGGAKPTAPATPSAPTNPEPSKSTRAEPVLPANPPASTNSDPAPSTTEPATIDQIVASIDLTKIPRMEGGKPPSGGPQQLRYEIRKPFAEIAEFYRTAFSNLGWNELKLPKPTTTNAEFLHLPFMKDGFYVDVAAYKVGSTDELTVSLTNWGNVDARAAPKLADAEGLAAFPNSCVYTTATNPEEAAKICRDHFTRMNWKHDPRPTDAFHRKEGRFIQHFVKNGMQFLVVVSRTPKGKTQVAYHPSIWDQAMSAAKIQTEQQGGPVTPAKYSEVVAAINLLTFPKLDGVTKADGLPHFIDYEAKGTVKLATKFYREQLSKAGWTEDTENSNESPAAAYLSFKKGHFYLRAGITPAKKVGTVEVQLQNVGNVNPSLLPRPEDAQFHGRPTHTVTHYNVKSSPAEAAEFLKNELTKLGWTVTNSKEIDGNYVLDFTQNAILLKFEIGKDTHDKTHVGIHPSVKLK